MKTFSWTSTECRILSELTDSNIRYTIQLNHSANRIWSVFSILVKVKFQFFTVPNTPLATLLMKLVVSLSYVYAVFPGVDCRIQLDIRFLVNFTGTAGSRPLVDANSTGDVQPRYSNVVLRQHVGGWWTRTADFVESNLLGCAGPFTAFTVFVSLTSTFEVLHRAKSAAVAICCCFTACQRIALSWLRIIDCSSIGVGRLLCKMQRSGNVGIWRTRTLVFIQVYVFLRAAGHCTAKASIWAESNSWLRVKA